MLKTAIGLAFAAIIASAGPVQARVTIIYPPQSYFAAYQFCPHYWDELYSDACTYVRYYRGRYGQHDDHDGGQRASVGVAQVNVKVVRSRRVSTVVIVAPGNRRD